MSNTTLNTRELAARESDGINVRLLWHPVDNALTVSVEDARVGLAGPRFVAVRDGLASMVERDAPYYAELGDDAEAWDAILDDMRQVAPPRRGPPRGDGEAAY